MEHKHYRVFDRDVKLAIQTLSEKTLRISLLPAEESVKDVFSTLDLENREWTEPSLCLNGSEGTQTVHAGEFAITVEPEPLKIQVSRKGHPVQDLSVCGETGSVYFPLGKGALFGLGHGYKTPMNRRGEEYDLRKNGLIRGIMENYSATSPSPYVISTDGWALYFHQPWKGEIHLTGETGCFKSYPEAYCDMFVVDCEEPMDAPKEYYAFTGMPPMPPKYAFGYQQSYRTLVHNGVNYVTESAKYMREHGIPCDMLIYLGTGYCDYGWNTWNGKFEWHPDVFPDPEKTMQELHDMHYKINLHVTRCYTGLHGSIDDESVSPLEYDHAKNYWERHERLYSTAKNECWWPDDADEVDMEARLTRHKMYYEGSLKLNPDVRPFQMQRNTFPGANKWGGIIWSGDVLSEWETLKNQVPIGLNVALSCSPYWGTDTGGFYSTAEMDGELFMRWMEYSVFTPFVRGHGRSSFLHNPWGWTIFQSLDEIPLELCPGMTHDAPPRDDILPDLRVEPLCKKYLELRYELLPYIYSLSHEACEGVPMMRPLWCYYPQDETSIATESEYFFGRSLLVAPVTAKSAETWDVYLPEGTWYDYWTQTAYTGGRTIAVDAPIDVIPLFVPAGGILAKGPVTQYVDTQPKDDFEPVTIEIYSGADGEYELYEDDGISLGYQRGQCSRTKIRWNQAEQKVSVEGTSTLFPGRTREITVRILPEGRTETVSVLYG